MRNLDVMINEFIRIYYLNMNLQRNKGFKVLTPNKTEDFLQSAFSSVTNEISQKMHTLVTQKSSIVKPINKLIQNENYKELNVKHKLVKGKLLSSEVPSVNELFKVLSNYSFNVKQMEIHKIEYLSIPFSSGSFNQVHGAELYFNDDPSDIPKKMVLKTPLIKPLDAKTYFYEIMKIHTITKHLASIFTEKLKSLQKEYDFKKGICFIDSFIVKSEPQDFFCVEPDLGSKFKKFTNNAFFYDDTDKIDIHLLLAFSHWSYEFTKHSYMVTDLQGTENILTDSTLNTMNGYFKKFGDLGIRGIASFFITHECNKVCNIWKLKRNKEFKNLIPRINTTDMVLECKNIFCGQDVQRRTRVL